MIKKPDNKKSSAKDEIIRNYIKELSGLKQKNERLSYDNLPFSTEDGT